MISIQFLGVLLLFLIGLRLSAFFSGSETGFYRVSLPRLTIDAQAGDPVAQRMLWFSRHPASFLSTTLVGNNLANYLTSFAISLGVVQMAHGSSDLWEVLATILLSPFVYLFGELLPKNLYYRAPMALLRRDSAFFSLFYWLFLPASWPLVIATRALERLSPATGRRTELVFGRSRLVQLLRQGRREGLLTDVQNRLASGVLQVAPQPVSESMTAEERILGVAADETRERLLEFARRHGVSNVFIRRSDSPHDWFAYVRVIDVVLDTGPLPRLFRVMPTLAASDGKLDALQKLQMAAEEFGVIKEGERVLGIASRHLLSEQLFRSSLTGGSLE